MSSFDDTVSGIAATLSILDVELTKCGGAALGGVVPSRFTFFDKARYVWDESLMRTLGRQLRDQRSSIHFLISALQQ